MTAMNKKALLSLLAASAVVIATPALAQDYGYGRGDGYGNGQNQGYRHNRPRYDLGQDLVQRLDRLEDRVNRMSSNGSISRSQYRLLQRQLTYIHQLQHAYARGGYNYRERAEVTAQLDRVQEQVRYLREDRYEDRDDHHDRRDRDDD